eukprot:g33338.t1
MRRQRQSRLRPPNQGFPNQTHKAVIAEADTKAAASARGQGGTDRTHPQAEAVATSVINRCYHLYNSYVAARRNRPDGVTGNKASDKDTATIATSNRHLVHQAARHSRPSQSPSFLWLRWKKE